MGSVSDTLATIVEERAALASDLDAIDEAAWTTPSLCPGWTVRDVLAHMTALFRMTPLAFFGKLLASGLSPSKVEARDIELERGDGVRDTLARFRAGTETKRRLHAVPTKTLLGETVLHAEDIRRPLGMVHAYPLSALVTIADAYRRSNLVVGTKRRIAGLSLQASDVEWNTGSGPAVSGPMLSLLLAMAGRPAAIEDLHGEGVDLLRSRP